MMLREQFSRVASRDIRNAMGLALSRHLENLRFNAPTGGTFQFSNVFDEWPSHGDRFIPPAAMVSPGAWRYDAARLTPTLIDSSWEPRDPMTDKPLGLAGWGLYKLADIDLSFEIRIRATHVAEREAIILGMESAFVLPDLLMNPDSARYGILLPMPEYYGLDARFALEAARVLDDEDRAVREHREAIFTVNGQANQVVIGPVRPMNLTIRVTEVETEIELEDC